MSQSEVNLNLHPKQADAFGSLATEILYGGAAGGGKSHLMRAAAVIWCASIPGLQVYLFRRIKEDLHKNHVEGPNGLRVMLAPWVESGLVQILEDEVRFWNGAKIWLCHCKDEKHRFKYLGAEIHVLLIDELTTFTDVIYRFLRSRVRAPGLEIPEEYQGRFPRIVCSSNPGNIGHVWVKAAFVDTCRDGNLHQMPDGEGGMLRQYIPARLPDNPSMAANDPDYRAKLRGLGSETLVKAMEDGDWDIIEGAYFDNWSSKLILRPFSIPEQWTRFRSFDWGSARPFSTGWWAIASDSLERPEGLIPKGALIRYREYYGCKRDKDGAVIPNTGLKMPANKVSSEIINRSNGEEYAYSVADPAIFSDDGGPSIAERMEPIYWTRADNKRVPGGGHMGGWDQMRQRIDGEDGRPMIYCFDTCTDSIRTIPALQHDPHRPEDVDSNMEDHAGDEWRYACMSRPWIRLVDGDNKPRDRWDKAFDDDDSADNWKTA